MLKKKNRKILHLKKKINVRQPFIMELSDDNENNMNKKKLHDHLGTAHCSNF